MITMSWHNILKIKFTPVKRDRPAPNIEVGNTPHGSAASYDPINDKTTLSNKNFTSVEETAIDLAHESTHEWQFKMEPYLVEMMGGVAKSLWVFVHSIKEFPTDELDDNTITDLWNDEEYEIGKNIRKFLEKVFTIEIQAYSIETDLSLEPVREEVLKLILNNFENTIKQLAQTEGLEPEKVDLVMKILIKNIRPLVQRMFNSFVSKKPIVKKWVEILKLDWREMLDSYITEDSLFENLYKHLTDSLGYNAPSKDEVIDYLEENYERHKLWSNLWGEKK